MNNVYDACRISWSGPLNSSVDIPATLHTSTPTSLVPCFTLAYTSLLTLSEAYLDLYEPRGAHSASDTIDLTSTSREQPSSDLAWMQDIDLLSGCRSM